MFNSVHCGIVQGGSLASLAAAISAANSTFNVRVCLLEQTDWVGGQLTSGGVPAVDFGPTNREPDNIVGAFADFLWGRNMPGDTNLGACWVSRKCFPAPLAAKHFELLLASLPKLQVFWRTSVLYAGADAGTHFLCSSMMNL